MLKKEFIEKKIAFHKERYEKALEKGNLDKAEFHASELDTWETVLLDF
jgi:hypothetical protein